MDQGNSNKICFIGAGHVGAPTAAIFAFFQPNLHVTVVDTSEPLIQKWNDHSHHFPLRDEADLGNLVRITRDGTLPDVIRNDDGGVHGVLGLAREPNLVFSSDVQRCIAEADIVFICVGTPTGRNGVEVDTGPLKRAVSDVAMYGKEGIVVVVKSTVPVGMAEEVRKMIAEATPGMSFEVLSNPEFLAEGEAIKNLLNPDRVLIGSTSTSTGQAAASALAEIYSSWVDPVRIQRMSNSSAELAKLAANAMLAQKISSINAVSAICEQTGADIQEIEVALGSDSRIGSDFLQAGIGFGGSCFKKDILNLSCLAESLNLSTVGQYWRQILGVNDYQCDRFVQHVVSRLGGSLFDKKIIIFGWAFKKGTSDPRESRSIEVFKALLEQSVGEIAIVDPRYRQSELQEEIFEKIDSISWEKRNPTSIALASEDPYQSCYLADAILILTDWDHFRCRPTTVKLPHVTSANLDSGDASGSSSTCFRTDDSPSEARVSPSSLSAYQENKIGDHGKKLLRNPTALLKPEPLCPSDCRDCHVERLSPWGGSNDQVDWRRIATAMKRPAWIFDGRSMVDIAEMERLGFRVEAIGKASA